MSWRNRVKTRSERPRNLSERAAAHCWKAKQTPHDRKHCCACEKTREDLRTRNVLQGKWRMGCLFIWLQKKKKAFASYQNGSCKGLWESRRWTNDLSWGVGVPKLLLTIVYLWMWALVSSNSNANVKNQKSGMSNSGKCSTCLFNAVLTSSLFHVPGWVLVSDWPDDVLIKQWTKYKY